MKKANESPEKAAAAASANGTQAYNSEKHPHY